MLYANYRMYQHYKLVAILYYSPKFSGRHPAQLGTLARSTDRAW